MAACLLLTDFFALQQYTCFLPIWTIELVLVLHFFQNQLFQLQF
jgi:hypothetical protein